MRCDAVRQIIEEGLKKVPSVEVHLTSCSACNEYLHQWETIRAGLVALRGEEPPEPSIGFAARVIHRLENPPAEFQFGQQFIDQIGRRMVYATLMVALTLLLVLLVPSSGPFRSSGVSESILVQVEAATLSNEQMLGVGEGDSGDGSDSLPVSAVSSSQGTRGSK
jgi:hypothetical protein